jgi:hypothetical protein
VKIYASAAAVLNIAAILAVLSFAVFPQHSAVVDVQTEQVEITEES